MKLVRFDEGKAGLIVQLPTGPHVVDVIASLDALAPRDPISQGILNGVLKDKGNWGPLLEHWPMARVGLKWLASTAAKEGSGVVLRRLDDIRTSADDGIISIDISESEVALDPTGRDIMARQFEPSPAITRPTDNPVIPLDHGRTPHWWL